MEYSSHGEYQIQIEPGCLVVRCNGGWNEQCANELATDIEAFVNSIESPFVTLVILDPDAIATPEALEVSAGVTQFLLDRGMYREAFVCPTSLQRDFIQRMLLAEYEGSYDVECFVDEQQARSWLATSTT